MDYTQLLILSLLYIMPAYVTNASAVLFRGKTRIDMGLNFFDGKPVLGKGKTVEGFVGAVIVGSLYGLLQFQFTPIVNPVTAFLMSFGAMTGDSIGSFIKRRLDLQSGELAPFLDQWDFVLGAFLFIWIAKFFIYVNLPTLTEALVILVMTVVVALLTNTFAYLIGLKEVPW